MNAKKVLVGVSQTRWTRLRSLLILAGVAGLATSILISVGVSIDVARNPLGNGYNFNWYVLSVSLMSIALALAFVGRGRWLLVITGTAMTLFIGITILRAGTGPAFLALAWILAVTAALGDRLLARIVPALPATPFERLLVSVSLGFGILAFLMLALGLLHLLYSLLAFGLVAFLTLVGLPSFRNAIHRIRSTLVPQGLALWRTADLRLTALVFSWGALSVWEGLVWAIAPSIHYDAMMYHLSVPALYLQAHAIIPITAEFRSYWAHNAEMLYTLGLLLTGQPLPGLLHWMTGLLLTGLIYCLGRRLGGVRTGLVAGLLFLSIPIVTWESGTAYIDLFSAFFVAGSLASVVFAWSTKDESWLLLGGIQAGLAAGTKLGTGIFLLPVALGVVVYSFRGRPSWVQSLRILLRFGIPAVLCVLPWWVRDWAWTGNPIFPFLNGVFGSRLFVHENVTFDFSLYGIGTTLGDLLQLPLTLMTRSEAFTGGLPAQLAGISLLAVPWLYASRQFPQRRLALLLVAIVTGSFLLWFHIAQYLRYLLPLVPALCVLAALNVEALWLELSRRAYRTLFVGLVLLGGLAYVISAGLENIASTWEIPDRYPWTVALGTETPVDYLSRALPAYDAFQFLDRKGGSVLRVAAVGVTLSPYNHSDLRQFARVPWTQGEPVLFESGAALANRLAAEGFDYLIIDENNVRSFPGMLDMPLVRAAFLDRYAALEFSRRGIEVYNLRPATVSPVSSENLLANPSFERVDWRNIPFKWSVEGEPWVDGDGAKAHSGSIAIRIDSTSSVSQRLAVEPDRLYTLGCWARADLTKESGQLELHFRDKNGNDLDGDKVKFPAASQWEWHRISLTSPRDTVSVQVIARVDQDSEVWFDDCRLSVSPP